MSQFDSAAAMGLAAVYDQYGQAGLWTPADGAKAIPVTVIPSEPDRDLVQGRSRVRQAAHVFEVRRSEVDTPTEGDILTTGGQSFRLLVAPEQDDARLIWLCEFAPA